MMVTIEDVFFFPQYRNDHDTSYADRKKNWPDEITAACKAGAGVVSDGP